MYKTIFALICLLAFSCQAQENQKFNLDFEKFVANKELPQGWFKWGKYQLSVSDIAYSGARSAKVTSDASGSSFGSIAYRIPANYQGDKIKLEGFMKMKEVSDGFAGLLLRIDGNGGSLAFDNMHKQEITGTRDWQKYSITLDYPEDAEHIYIAGILTGKGEAWFDNFTLSIDGDNVQFLPEVEKQLAKALTDHAFDKGSNIKLAPLSAHDIDKLDLLGRVWGFLKYYHPKIAKGNFNWDYELFRFLPKYMDTDQPNEHHEQLIKWVTSLGEVKDCKTCQPIDEKAYLKPDLAWVDQQPKELKDILHHIYQNRAQGDHYYIAMTEHVGNPIFRHEAPYLKVTYPDEGLRLLSLYRYWNMIQYFFPYKHLMEEDWNTKLAEYIPLFIQAEDELAYELAVIQLIADIQDTHANLWAGADKINNWKGVNYPPVHLRFIENKWVVTDYYNQDLKGQVGLKIGDIITHIDGIQVEEIVREKEKYYPASNRPTRLREMGADLLRSNNKTIKIGFIAADGDNKSMEMGLYPKDSLNMFRWYKEPEGKSFKMLENNIGYVTLANIQEEDVAAIKQAFKDTKGIIIDIRNYPSTFVPFILGSFFVTENTPFVKFTNANVDHPGEFTFTDNLGIPTQEETYKGKLVVLVNELSQSSAEYTAMAFRAGDNTTIVGSITAGADGNVSTIMLPGGLKTMISGIGVYYPDGGETQRIGIVPDVVVQPSIEGIRRGEDELLEEAKRIIIEN